jgi:mannose/fructose/N-acetylgalactosamine-specific phosphotransferase system component IIC
MEVLGVVLLGALVALDQVSFAQIQLSHPLVAGTLAGALAGGAMGAVEGALVGALLGLVLAGHRPVGGVIPPDGGLAAVVAGAALGRQPLMDSGTALAFALLAGLGLAVLGRGTESWTRAVNLGLLRRAESMASARGVRRAVAAALALAAGRGAVTVLLALPVVTGFVARGGEEPSLARGAVIAVAGGIGIGSQERLLGRRRGRGILLALAGLLLAVLPAILGWTAAPSLSGLPGGPAELFAPGPGR